MPPHLPLPDAAPPSVVATRQATGRADRREGRRAYPLAATSQDLHAIGAELAASKALLRAESDAELGLIVLTLVHDLGGALFPARDADPATAIPVDVSLGLSEPMLACADPDSLPALRLGAVLPDFLEGARLVLDRRRGEVRRGEEATRDPLTGVLTRRAWMRRVSGAVPGDGICLIDLDHFKALNDAEGHAAGDAALHVAGGLMLRTFRSGDACGRYGGDEFVCFSPGLPAQTLLVRCEELRHAWVQERPAAAARVGLSIGVAEVSDQGARAALSAADSAMYRGKFAGGNRTVLASPEDNARAPA